MSLPTNSDLEAQPNVPQDQGDQVVPDNGSPGQPGPPDRGSDSEPPMIGEFGSSANALWRLYVTETNDFDITHIQSVKLDMERIITFTGLFAVVLTAFVIDGKQGLKVNPQDQMVYYLQQNIAMLDQISRQISFVAPQITIPPTPPAPFPDFKPSASDIRVNVYWFMSLVFSLSAAFLATIVQQSARDYIDAFLRYSDPLKNARLRQYLYEGLERWCMPIVEVVTGILHVSLFLFFMGLCDFILNINTTIGLTTMIPIAVTGLLYIAATLAQPICPQLPFRTSLSGVIWRAFQKFIIRGFGIRGPDGVTELVSSDIVERQMQLAMARTKDRVWRDEQAIRRLVFNMTDVAEIESLMIAIVGSFSDAWGMKVWKKILSPHPLDLHSVTTTSYVGVEDIMQVLSVRVGQLLDTCKNQSQFATAEEWRRRTRACVETMFSLFSCTGAMHNQVENMLQPLGDLGSYEGIRELSWEGRDEPFVMHWTCLSLMAIQPILKSTSSLHNDARQASLGLERSDNTGETRLEKIIKAFDNASKCLESFAGLPVLGETEDRVKQILYEHESQISKLEEIDIDDTELGLDDESINSVQQSVDRITHGVTRQLPGVKPDIPDTKSDDISQFIELFRDPDNVLFILPLRNLRRIRSFAKTIREILEGYDVDALRKFQKTIKDLREIELPLQLDNLFRRQSWHLQDLQDGGLGFIVEVFFLALKQLLSKSSSRESHSALYIGTFRTITTDWTEPRNSPGTQKLLLDMVVPYRGLIFSFEYPPDIVTAFLVFLGHILQGQTGAHIDEVTELLTDAARDAINPRYRALSIEVLRRILAPQSSS